MVRPRRGSQPSRSRSPRRCPPPRYKVRVTKDELVFSAGHFITFAGDQCERIHGHNYRVAVEVEDDLDENHYVFDFIALRDLTRGHHRRARPPDAPADREPADRARGGRPELAGPLPRPVLELPRDECVLLPVANTTAELLADHIAGRLREQWAARGLTLPRVLRVEVEESFGQSAEVEWRRPDPSP